MATCLIIGAVVLVGQDTDAQVTPSLPESPLQHRPLTPVKGDDPRWPAVRGMGICSTDYGWCPLAHPELVPDGAPCYCVTEAHQQITGVAVARMYYGNVSPYFNPWR